MIGTLTPAYGRDYKSKAAVAEALAAGQDFIDTNSGKPINKPQLLAERLRRVTVRYGALRKVAIIEIV